MFKSRYAIEATGRQGEPLLYNASNGAFVQLGAAARACWETGDFEADAVKELVDCGLVTELSPEDELERQRDLFDRERMDTSHLTISLVPTYVCNYRCPYCYELGHNKIKGKMNARTMDAVESFVQFKYEQDSFGRLSVQWYGGDPSLALDEVAEITRRLVAWCEQRNVTYDAVMITNANVIDEAAAQLIADCRISLAFLTIDGPEELHNKRRVAANGSNSYAKTIEAARLLSAHGIRLAANMNADKVNIKHYDELRQKLFDEEGIMLTMGKLNDYGHFYGTEPFCAPDFDLFTHDEFFVAQFEEFAKREHGADELRSMLRPARRFCTGQYDNYFVIDLLGDVYNCDGWVGDKGHVRFNLFDDPSTWKLHEVTLDATRDPKCEQCEILPICQGNCLWERECSGMPCHPFKTTIGDYLALYRTCFDADADASDTTVLAEPFSPADLGWE